MISLARHPRHRDAWDQLLPDHPATPLQRLLALVAACAVLLIAVALLATPTDVGSDVDGAVVPATAAPPIEYIEETP